MVKISKVRYKLWINVLTKGNKILCDFGQFCNLQSIFHYKRHVISGKKIWRVIKPHRCSHAIINYVWSDGNTNRESASKWCSCHYVKKLIIFDITVLYDCHSWYLVIIHVSKELSKKYQYSVEIYFMTSEKLR